MRLADVPSRQLALLHGGSCLGDSHDEGGMLTPPGLMLLGACVHLITHPWNPWTCAFTQPSCSSNCSAGVPVERKSSRASTQPPYLTQQTQGQGPAFSTGAQESIELVLAGALSRTMAQAIIHPLDTIKTRLQVTSPSKDLRRWQRGFTASLQGVQALGLRLRAFNPASLGRAFNSASLGGLSSLYMGLTGTVLTTLPSAAVFFATNEACKHHLRMDNTDRRDALSHIISAGVASLASAVIRVPGDVLKHRVQAFMYPNVFVAARHVWQTTGLRGLYCGFGATLLRDMPEMTIQFTLYEALRKALTPSTPDASSPHPLMLGGLAGAVAAVATTPVDVVKCQLQCQGGTCDAWAAVNSIMQQRGPSGFIAGMAPRVLQTAVCSAIFFACFEGLQGQMRGVRQAAGAAPPRAGVESVGAVRPLLTEVMEPMRV